MNEVSIRKAGTLLNTFIEDELKGDTELLRDMDRFSYLLMYIRTRIKVNREDIEELDRWFEFYDVLCTKYGHTPTLFGFGRMTGIHQSTLSKWGKIYRGAEYVNAKNRWKEECAAAHMDKLANTTGTNVNAIFAAKAMYGFTDQPTNMIEEDHGTPIVSRTRAQIAAEIADPDEIDGSSRPYEEDIIESE
mgnify:CR=1 FL=1